MTGLNRFTLIAGLIYVLSACSSNPPAPVIDRLPPTKPSASASKSATGKPAKPVYKPGDWRPDTYTVKKGDTLFSIGLEYGYDYKEIAQANNITAPYTIRIGQVLKFNSIKNAPEDNTAANGVVITPIGTASAPDATSNGIATPVIVAITEPKAIREPYSEDALKKPTPVVKAPEKTVITPAVTPKTDVKPEAKTDTSTTNSVEDIDWAWPAKGKVIASFNEASNKGIDIAGSNGQPIYAAASGKVIYSGSDLRGYGKLVIVKHNATYLSVYAHNSLISVKEGQQVSRGQKIAEMGNTDSNTTKLHFEIRRQGKSVDPSKYLANN